MKFSTRTRYGLKALLLLAGRFGEGSMAVSQIAKEQEVSTPYLEQILNALKKKGFVKSVRGPQGGYVLARKPSEITLADLFTALEGKNSLDGTVEPPVTAESAEMDIAGFIFWKKFTSLLKDGLSRVTLKELMDEAHRLKKTKSSTFPATFHI